VAKEGNMATSSEKRQTGKRSCGSKTGRNRSTAEVPVWVRDALSRISDKEESR